MRRHALARTGPRLRAPIPARSHGRVLGRWGTVSRVVGGLGLIVLAAAVWQADWLDLAIGLVALPAVATSLMFLRDRSSPPLRLGAAGHLVTVTHVAITATVLGGEVAALFYGSMALVAALHGNCGCEVTVIANWLRGRDDRVGCPVFEPFDVLDRTLANRRDRAR
jgi:hypothetical protein